RRTTSSSPTGYTRKYAIRLLSQPVEADSPAAIHRPRAPRYGAEVAEALHLAWVTLNEICSKRLVPFLPELIPRLEQHGHLTLTEASEEAAYWRSDEAELRSGSDPLPAIPSRRRGWGDSPGTPERGLPGVGPGTAETADRAAAGRPLASRGLRASEPAAGCWR